MLINELNISSLLLITKIPFWIILRNTLFFAIFFSFLLKRVALKNNLLGYLILIIFVSGFFYYFGLIPSLLIFVLFAGSLFLGFKLLGFEDIFLSFIAGFFIFIEIYILVGLIFGLKAAMITLILFSFFLFIFRSNLNKKLIKTSIDETGDYLNKINFLDLWLIALSFTIGSQPQTHWDAVYANLYNAKWYVLNNSLKPLAESISSLFPQNAILYYSFFYQIGQEKMLQLSFLIPLLLIILVFKNILEIYKFKKSIRWLCYLMIFTPIVVFESSNGYYDCLILSLLISALYLVISERKNDLIKNSLLSSFFIGFAAAIRYFPIILLLLPLTIVFYHKVRKTYLTVFIMFFLAIFPVSIWLYRAYASTGSPIFPFFQSLFPTPNLWSGSELASNFMIQTTMKTDQWIKGGFLFYPFLSYFKTEQYMEATRGFPGLIYIFFVPLQIIIFARIIKNAVTCKFQKTDLLFLTLFLVYFCVGIFSRYYRYLWPFQFLWAAATFIYLTNLLNKFKVILLLPIIFILLFININDILGYFRFFPITLDQLWQPNFFQVTNIKKNPVSYLNISTSRRHDIKILDASQYLLPRLHLTAQVYECNWYWVDGVQTMFKAEKDINMATNVFRNFDFIITSVPITNANNFCYRTIEKNLSLLKNVYQDKGYLIYKVLK